MGVDLPSRVSEAKLAAVSGEWHRHVPLRYQAVPLQGVAANGRWGRRSGFPVLYLGRPVESVVVEGYRHLVDPVDGAIAAEVAPRVLVTCDVDVTSVLDLRQAGNRLLVGLTMETLKSAVDDRDAYEACRDVAAVAHQLGLAGVVAPAATGLGETLALFPQNMELAASPVVRRTALWEGLPADPRAGKRPGLRLV